jgi:hypothetical protein
VHLSLVGGEPLVRYSELCDLLPLLDRTGVEVQLVTSAVRPPEHDRRRAPATYERILKNIARHRVIVHCTVSRQMLGRRGYLTDFCRFWSGRPEARRIWFSLYTPQEGEDSPQRLRPQDRETVLDELCAVAAEFPKVHLPREVLEGYRNPPPSPRECTFARVTTCLSADLRTRIGPCQLGGRPVCTECGCMAAAGMHAVSEWKLAGIIPLSTLLNTSIRVGARLAGSL